MSQLAVLTLILCLASPALPARAQKLSLAQIQELLEDGQTTEVRTELDRLIRKNPKDAQAFFLRSTAHIIDGDLDSGRRDLLACLKLDPNHRQGWLNRAALDLVQKDYSAAVAAFTKAEALDPQAPDNSLNIGAALLLGGDRGRASDRFRRYLQRHPDDANAYYLVAANYAMADLPELATGLLRRAIQLDERTRLRARTDANFAALSADAQFQDLLSTDSFRLPEDGLGATRSYDFPFTGRDSRVLEATLTALQLAGYPISSGVEVTPLWALVWGDVRIKIAANDRNGTDIFISAEADSHSPEEWEAKTEDIFRRIALQLSSRLPSTR
jgi:tetratricopeptide (TPR) repeat protein